MRLRMMIVDDEGLEREGLEFILKTLMPDRFEIALAENGRRAIEIAEEFYPDIVFMDIKMPGISGLDAARALRDQVPDCRIIFVTAYDDFQYAREALQVGAKDYLLKPVKREKLLELVDQLVSDIAKERRKRQSVLDLKEKIGKISRIAESDCALHLMQGILPSEEHYHLLGMEDANQRSGYCLVVNLPNEIDKQADMKTLIHEHLPHNECVLVSPIVSSHISIFCILQHEIGKHAPYRTQALQNAQALSRILDRSTDSSLHIIGIGSKQFGPSGWTKSYLEANQATRIDSNSKWRFYEDIRKIHAPSQLIELEKQLIQTVLEGNMEQTNKAANEFVTVVFESYGNDLDQIYHILLNVIAILKWELAKSGITAPNFDISNTKVPVAELAETFQAFIQLTSDSLDEMFNHSISALQRTKSFMETHYAEDLTLEMMADMAQLSPFYFSKQFKAAFGQSFVEYLTHLRMEAARELIEQRKYNLKEICFHIGYNSPTYFSRVFKKHYGVAPSEWKSI
ncbi:response regulator [Fodinisporobacter ferrooxydans]|uniref:Response regulator n=1 Tax=Fodinisporobacter ferrooxydans TaxID=2901836 RepID=A0ABY4CP14_9BACL|nr:response regulator [Alicyclobacillaceae bacterium MYW30-H2]